jgi:hypothetical protein
MSGILGSNGNFPCPICLIPKDKQSKLGGSWPRRTSESASALCDHASQQKTKKGSKNVLKTESLRGIVVSTPSIDAAVITNTDALVLQNTFLIFFSAFISIFQAFVLDPLHAIEQGEHGRHLWPWLVESLPPSSLAEIDSW